MKKSLVYAALLVVSSSMIGWIAYPIVAHAMVDQAGVAIENGRALILKQIAVSSDHNHDSNQIVSAEYAARTDLHNSQMSLRTDTKLASVKQTSTPNLVLASALTPTMNSLSANHDKSSAVEVTDQIALGDIASFHFPSNHQMSFVEPKATQELLQKQYTGDLITGQILGSLLDRQDNAWIILMYTEDGHILDYDHDQIDAQRILNNYQNNLQQQNANNKEAPNLQVLGWGEEPSYNATTHTLTWYLKLKESTKDNLVNYNARMLTRTGYLSAILVSSDATFQQDRTAFQQDVLPNIDIHQQSAYSAYDEQTDKDSKLTLEGLILIGAGTQAAKQYGTFSIVNKLWFIVVPIAGLIYWNHRNRSRREQEHAKELEAIMYADHQSNELPMRRRPVVSPDQTDSDSK